MLYWRTLPAEFSSFEVQGLVISALPLVFAAMAQAVVVISGGIDLSVGSLMSVVNVISAEQMLKDPIAFTSVSYRQALLISVLRWRPEPVIFQWLHHPFSNCIVDVCLLFVR